MENLTAIDRPLFHLTRRENLPAILRSSRVDSALTRPANETHRELWSPSFRAKRTAFELPFGDRLALNAFASLHIGSRIPAALNVATGVGVERTPNHDIIILRTTGRRLLEHFQPFAVATAQPLAGCAAFIPGPAGLDEIDWGVVERRDYRRDPKDPNKTARAGAEILVHSSIPVEVFDEVLCWDAEDELLAERDRHPNAVRLKVARRTEAFFPQGA